MLLKYMRTKRKKKKIEVTTKFLSTNTNEGPVEERTPPFKLTFANDDKRLVYLTSKAMGKSVLPPSPTDRVIKGCWLGRIFRRCRWFC